MNHPLRIASVLLLALAGCGLDLDVVSGSVREGDLTSSQLAELNLWLKTHRNDWKPNLASPPPPSCIVSMTLANGDKASLEFYGWSGWLSSVQIETHGRPQGVILNQANVPALRNVLGCPS